MQKYTRIILIVSLFIIVGFVFYNSKKGNPNSLNENQIITDTSIKTTESEEENATSVQTTNSSSETTDEVVNSNINLEDIRDDIVLALDDAMGEYSVLIEDLNTGQFLKINEQTQYLPASIYKVPLAMIALRDVDDEKIRFEDKAVLISEYKTYTSDTLSQAEDGQEFSLFSILEYLIRQSDNTAQQLLISFYSSEGEMVNRIEDELEIDIWDDDLETLQFSVDEVADLFEKIYEQNYLSKESNDLLIEHLTNVTSAHKDRIEAVIPEEVDVAHKIGQLDGIYQDAGIVYNEKNPYIIVVLDKNTTPENARNVIQNISKITWDYYNRPK